MAPSFIFFFLTSNPEPQYDMIMKTYFTVVFLVVALLSSCKDFNTKIATIANKARKDSVATDSNAVRVIKEYFSNGKVKTEISVKGNLRHGLTKNYDRDGSLLSQVNYVENVKDGMATNFYAKSGKINSTLIYKNGIKEGDEIWYWESGRPYRVTPYVKGLANGTQKYYYEDGKLKAEVPWKNGKPGVGIKEYNNDGSMVTGYPQLIIKQKDYIGQANKVILSIELSDPDADVKFYRGSLLEGKYLSNNQLELAMQNRISQIDFNVPPGASINEKVVITANVKTKFGYPLILTKTYVVSASNN